jgi:hypothetical protein
MHFEKFKLCSHCACTIDSDSLISCAFKIDAVISVPRERIPDESTINDLMAKWFRNSIDRQGGQTRRKKANKFDSNGNTAEDTTETNQSGSGGINTEGASGVPEPDSSDE